MSEAAHVPVMLEEVLTAIDPRPGELIVDATFGAGGYSKAFLERGCGRVVGFDRDPNVKGFSEALGAIFPGRFDLVERPFSELEDGLDELGFERCNGLAFDLGVSSMQLDEAERGFSFVRDGPLDMRMSRRGPTAADLVNTADVAELSHLFHLYGEERAARRIAQAICRRRTTQPFHRTLDLAETIEKAVGGRKGAPIHPATRVFQALRIAVNDELHELEAGLLAAERLLTPGGRLAVVTFHSLEDRIVKTFLNERAGAEPSPSRHLPPAARGPEPSFEPIFKGARAASETEAAKNPRARSAKLRAARRTAAPAWPRKRRAAA
jgi:16S rRNA (cytosine1402-N4)-methyltransferase